MRLWPRRAGGQLALLLILVLLVAQVITIVILAGERQGALRSASLEHVLQRVADGYTLADTTDPERQERILRALSSPTLRLSIDPAPYLTEDQSSDMRRRLAEELGLPMAQVRTAMEADGDDCLRDRDDHRDRERHDDEDDEHHEYEEHRDDDDHHDDRHECPPVLGVSLALSSGQWFNARARPPAPSWLWLKATLTSVGITAVLLTLTLLLAVRRILRPMNELSQAAHAFGRGEKVRIPEKGPEDVREVTRAFNQMQDQVGRAQEDRARLLAALAHDLRTPITSMRLRVEMLPEGEDRDRLLDSLREMQHLAEATLDFIRGTTTEQHRRYDLATLLDSLCGDLQEMGLAVHCDDSPRCVLQGQPEAVKRALRNLIENAVNYGEQAEVTLATTDTEAVVTIVDQGPGILEADRERVFEPFYRLEHSRSRETGGAGLGLAIARTLIRGMGGDIRLDAGPGGQGLQVSVTLPKTR
ncbi:HAMP domain-containing sensor histidine kinase [Marinobacter adhaerens]|jgi:signal transduction histidine kinase|uniref:histidine kinase n=2 Tax=Marinobacter adhaerens TaxID=1033846 RepID=A0ABX8IIF2_9GAMM|nr:HAMP domain-containing sensor histidine kinase [Marinobacter adhaerens]ADP99726.1 two-component system sensor histidine kinase [Marinobacter adhaerens HP15]MBW4978063.1 HAMP domain-containing histidine kinase [Marinobacter adhaerens]QWV13612.1 HAMP domain-containing histidine kinase [Marinobacter adhaerens]